MSDYLSPLTSRPLHADTPHSLSDGAGERWPVVDGIAFFRRGSEVLAAEALCALDAGDRDAALVLLLAENDRWWDGAPPPEPDLRRLVAERERLSLREAMNLLGWGRVGTYFAHRWSDPTFVAGLSLLDAHWVGPRTAFELACGIGHYLRELGRAGVDACGADVVFAKLWVARHWVSPRAELLCFDAEGPWPVVGRRFDLALCQDAFYFLADKSFVAARLREAASERGVLTIGHVHNRDWPNFSSGAAVTLPELRALFPDALMYADEALTKAGVAGAVPCSNNGLGVTEAFGLACGPGLRMPRAAAGPLSRPPAGARLRRNPLCGDAGSTPAWPSERYAAEYGPRATFGCRAVPDEATMGPEWADAAARRELVDLPERW
ncbi:MAG: SAM-dependent methyltransferase [uncultured Sphingomonadaceae bacterium]|uniref:SAM-dependent methyltransferase n=1 Tax=uncultured Sphingomonadaceae bacterium TaxID=169976 RepID=A0A6J4RWF2_9SPHN|nr:MAG: SAM-dependent methyltransferase [uncultured Sphingomonadaceae bacterium]